MKTITIKDLVPQDPTVKALLKRIALVFTVYLILGIIAAKFGLEYPVLIFIGLLLISSFLGLIHWLSVHKTEEKEKTFEQLGMTGILAIIASLSLLIPLLLITPSLVLFTFSGLFFGIANLIGALVAVWANQPVFIPEKAEVLNWVQAFLQSLVIPNSRYYIIFKWSNGKTLKKIGLPVDRKCLYRQNEITLQALWSNWVHRHNAKATNENLIATQYTQNPKGVANHLFSFYQRRFYFFHNYLSPKIPFSNTKCKWRFTLERNDLNQRVLVPAVVIYVNLHEPSSSILEYETQN